MTQRSHLKGSPFIDDGCDSQWDSRVILKVPANQFDEPGPGSGSGSGPGSGPAPACLQPWLWLLVSPPTRGPVTNRSGSELLLLPPAGLTWTSQGTHTKLCNRQRLGPRCSQSQACTAEACAGHEGLSANQSSAPDEPTHSSTWPGCTVHVKTAQQRHTVVVSNTAVAFKIHTHTHSSYNCLSAGKIYI